MSFLNYDCCTSRKTCLLDKPEAGFPDRTDLLRVERDVSAVLRHAERVLGAARSLALWDLGYGDAALATNGHSPNGKGASFSHNGTSPSNGSVGRTGSDGMPEPGAQRRHELTIASLVQCREWGSEVALLGLSKGWSGLEVSLALPLCQAAGNVLALQSGDEQHTLSELRAKHRDVRFVVLLPMAVPKSEEELEQRAFTEGLAMLRQEGEPMGFPCRSGAFDWLWSYAPYAVVPPGLRSPLGASPSAALTMPRRMPRGQPALSAHVVTLNCGGEPPPPPEKLALLLGSQDAFLDKGSAPPTVLAVALQEVCAMYHAFLPNVGLITPEGDAAEAWGAALDEAVKAFFSHANKGRPSNSVSYKRVVTQGLVGLLLLVWTREELEEPAITSTAKCGAFHAGNKGAVAASFGLRGGLRVCLVDLHLAAGRGHAKERARDMEEVVRQLRFGAGLRNVFEHDLVIFTGDYNSHLVEPLSDEELVAMQAPADAKPARIQPLPEQHGDELTRLRGAMVGFWGLLDEAPITFPPTYKIEIGQETFDASRHPAWCDRVLWWSRPRRLAARARRYGRIGTLRFSDHRAVFLQLDLCPAGLSSGASSRRVGHNSRGSSRGVVSCSPQ